LRLHFVARTFYFRHVEAVLIGDTYYLQDLLSNPYAILLGSLAELFEDLEATVDLLTSKEKEIFDLYVSGNSLVAIMNKLAIAKSTIHTHMESIRAKFKVEANRELITKYQICQIKVDKSEN
jgi:DNA-binding CsgD family transcriptional regulator